MRPLRISTRPAVCSSDSSSVRRRHLSRQSASRMDERQLLADEATYCSFGDTVHYQEPPKIFDRCEGSFLYDAAGLPFLDLQMWYSAVNFGYANPRHNDAMKRQLD